jgi:Flp pilus assembly protein TadD
MHTSADPYTALLDQARACITRKEYRAATTLVRDALALDPSRPEGLNLQGALLELNRDWTTARKYYRAALAFDPSYKPAQANLSRTLPWCLLGEIRLG